MRPKIEQINNGGKVFLHFDKEVEFPDDFVDQLNKSKDKFVLMQIAKDGEAPEPLPETLPQEK